MESDFSGMGKISAESLEGFRSYLLTVAGRRMGRELAAKVGLSDLVQETLLAAGRDSAAYRGGGPDDLKPWLRGILLHLLANLRRRYRDTAKRRLEIETSLDAPGPDGAAWSALADTATSASALAMREELRGSVNQALAQLPENYRRVLTWRYREGLTFDAIGERLETSADAARKLWGRAVVRLRETLGPGHDTG